MRGDVEARDRWREIVAHYHPGSKAIYRQLYPARHSKQNAKKYSGLVNYSWSSRADQRTLTNVAYSDISHEGIAAGYDDAGEHEPEFIAAVERASRLDHDPRDKGTQRKPGARFVRRLARVYPLTMALGGFELSNGEGFATNLSPIDVAITTPDGLDVTLELPWRTVRTRESYRDYDPATYRWRERIQGMAGTSQLGTSLPDGTQPTRLRIPVTTPVREKRIITIDIEILA